MYFLLKNGDIPASYVSVPEGFSYFTSLQPTAELQQLLIGKKLSFCSPRNWCQRCGVYQGGMAAETSSRLLPKKGLMIDSVLIVEGSSMIQWKNESIFVSYI